jgi:hypothetical protein
MTRSWQILLVTLFTGTLAAVGLQVVWPFLPPGEKLHGVSAEPPPVKWDWTEFKQGNVAREIEAWYNVRVGLRNFWVELDNQISYTFFGEVNPRAEGSRVIGGEHDWLFEYQYIETAVSMSPYADKVPAVVAHLKSLQEKLARRGIPLLVVVAPSKVEVYPEHVPAAYFGGRNPAGYATDFELARPLMQAAGINFYDGPARFAAWKAAGERNLFARAGTHWSHQASLRVLAEIRDRLNPVMRHPLPELVVSSSPVGPPRETDRDLLDLTNLLVSTPYEHPLPYPVLKPQHAIANADLPRILWVHDSFGWVLIDQLYAGHAMQPSESLYYFATRSRIPGAVKIDTDLKKIDWETYLKSYDAVIIVWTEIAFDFDSWGFSETLDRALP